MQQSIEGYICPNDCPTGWRYRRTDGTFTTCPVCGYTDKKQVISMFESLFCRHKWITIKRQMVETFEYESSSRPYEFKAVTLQECSKCGKVRKQVLKFQQVIL